MYHYHSVAAYCPSADPIANLNTVGHFLRVETALKLICGFTPNKKHAYVMGRSKRSHSISGRCSILMLLEPCLTELPPPTHTHSAIYKINTSGEARGWKATGNMKGEGGAKDKRIKHRRRAE